MEEMENQENHFASRDDAALGSFVKPALQWSSKQYIFKKLKSEGSPHIFLQDFVNLPSLVSPFWRNLCMFMIPVILYL